jgi:hypothetical protein
MLYVKLGMPDLGFDIKVDPSIASLNLDFDTGCGKG